MVELIRPVVPDDVARILGSRAGVFAEIGVPVAFDLASLTADPELTAVETARGRTVVAFGRSANDYRLVLRPEDGAVLEVSDRSSAEVWVSGSLGGFVAAVELVDREFPTHDPAVPDDVLHRAAATVRELVAHADPTALRPDEDTWWSTFADDVENGDMADGDR